MTKKNTKTQMNTEPNGNTIKTIRLRKWCVTINNPTDVEKTQWTQLCSKAVNFAWQIETGENGTPHIQGCVEFKNPVKFSTLKNKIERAHWEPARNWEASMDYCQKDETRIEGPFTSSKPKVSKISGRLRLWQCIMQKYLMMKPDDRTVVWVCDEKGNNGKTLLCKHMCTVHDAVYLNGPAKYMKYAVTQLVQQGTPPKILLLDLARSQEQFVSYQGIEELKNGIFFNVHYEAQMVTYDEPHLVVFANFMPDQSKLSADRWKIIEL